MRSPSVAETDSEVGRALAELVSHSPSYARLMGIELDHAGRPKAPDLARASQQRVVIKARVKALPS